MSRPLPSGWTERTNASSEFAASAARSFSAHGALSEDGDARWKTSEEVAHAWFARIDADAANGGVGGVDWDRRARERAAMGGSSGGEGGARARAGANASSGARGGRDGVDATPEIALTRVATLACESLAAALDARAVSIPEEDRAAFAASVKRALDAVVACR